MKLKNMVSPTKRGSTGSVVVIAILFSVAAIFCLVVNDSAVAQEMLLGVSWEGYSYKIEPFSGNATELARPDRMFNAMARDSAGKFIASDNSNWLHLIDSIDGSAQFITSISGGGLDETIRGMAFTPDDRLFAVMGTPFATVDNFYEIDLSLGIATLIGNTGMIGLQSLAVSPTGVIYSFDIAGNGKGLVTIDSATGLATDINPLVGDSNADLQSLAFSRSNTLYAVGEDAIYTINVNNGALSKQADCLIDIRGMEFLLIPEPSTTCLSLVSIVGLSSLRPRRFSRRLHIV
jgi:hypothetical protein